MKSVIMFIEKYDSTDGEYKYFTESAEFGIDCHYPSATSFVGEFQKMYSDFNNKAEGRHRFTILNVVIG